LDKSMSDYRHRKGLLLTLQDGEMRPGRVIQSTQWR
jgi:hypothetical protein